MIGYVVFDDEAKHGGPRGTAATAAAADAVIRVDDTTGAVTVLKDRHNLLTDLPKGALR